jgi:hypothetical protein
MTFTASVIVLPCPAMPNNKTERRGGERVPVRVPLTISATETNLQATGHTRDLSSNGIFFYTDFPIRQGNNVEMVLILPPELTSGEKRWVCCQATVVRVEDDAEGNRHGVAAKVRTMEFLPELIG